MKYLSRILSVAIQISITGYVTISSNSRWKGSKSIKKVYHHDAHATSQLSAGLQHKVQGRMRTAADLGQQTLRKAVRVHVLSPKVNASQNCTGVRAGTHRDQQALTCQE